MNIAGTPTIKTQRRKIIGLRSAHSFSGTDVVLVEVDDDDRDNQSEIISTYHHPHDPSLKQLLLQLFNRQGADGKMITQANIRLTRSWSEAIEVMLNQCKINAGAIDLIGCQGFSIYDHVQQENGLAGQVEAIIQIGDPAILARLTGISSTGEFNLPDFSAPVEVPLETYLDWIFFSKLKKEILVLNAGNQISCTYIPADGDRSKMLASYIGPGNGLIDQLMQRLYELPFDRNGVVAGLGSFSEKLFNYIQKMDQFPGQVPPKYLGRKQYGLDFVLSVLRQALRWRIPEPDIIHSICRYVVFTTWKAVQDFIPRNVQEVVIGGSSCQNSFLMQLFQEYFPYTTIKKLSDYNLPSDFKEAVCSALLANECVRGISNNKGGHPTPGRLTIFGKICVVHKNGIQH